jgi:DNA-directed RNA polymerase alpha subunit
MVFEITLKKGTALSLANSLRQIAMGRVPAWRPVAFTLNREINILNPSPEILEDSTSIMSNLLSYRYTPKRSTNESIIRERYTFTKVLKVDGMQADSEAFNIVGEDINLITCLDDRPVELTVVYRFSFGNHTDKENTQFLKDEGTHGDYVVLASRHTNVVNFTYRIDPKSLEEERLILDIVSDIHNEEELLQDSINLLKQSVIEMDSIVQAKDPGKYVKN